MNTLLRRRTLIRRSLLSAMISISIVILPSWGQAQEEIVISHGKRDYLTHCAICHGMQGKGDGPMSQVLTIVPADLTQLKKKNDGEFPFWRMYKVIDGRDQVRAHGTRNMPVWGAHFLSEEGGGYLDEDRVIGRVLGLVYYLRSIQEP